MEYQYVVTSQNEVNTVLAKHARVGWRVHTFHRNSVATVVDILFERNDDCRVEGMPG